MPLLKGKTTVEDETVERFVRDVVAAVRPLRIILFGSRARGEGRATSDIDLLVVMPDGTDRRRVAMKLYEEIPRHGTAMDVVVTTPSALERHKDNLGYVYRTALKEGREVYAAP